MKSLHSEIQHINLRHLEVSQFKSGTIISAGFEQEMAKPEDMRRESSDEELDRVWNSAYRFLTNRFFCLLGTYLKCC